MKNKKIILWWSGGITSAVACKVALELFGDKNDCRVVMIDTMNEDSDTYRFKKDCEIWYGKEIESITCISSGMNTPGYTFVDVGKEYGSIQDVWIKHRSLNVATGAICSTKLKRRVREEYQETVSFDHQVFGYEFDKKECNRALSLSKNHPKAKGIYPLLMVGYNKEDCINIVKQAGIEIPRMYKLGFRNNNCFGTGCVQGGIGYWQKMKVDFPDKFDAMADMEHRLTDMRGEPVTMLKDQGNEASQAVADTNERWRRLVFLKKHKDYPELKCIDDMKQMDVAPLVDCNGFCGTNDLNAKTKTDQEINYAEEQPGE